MSIGLRLSRLLGNARTHAENSFHERSKIEELAAELLKDVGLTPSDLARMMRRT